MELTKVKKKAGRISPTPMGDYDNTTVYRRLDWVYYGGTSYICKKNNTVGITPINVSNWQKLLDPPSDTPIYFNEVTTRQNISSGEKLSVILGKIKKCISDIKDVAFSGSYNDLSDTPNSLKNPNALNIKFNGTSKASYDGSAAKEVNVTPDAINAINTSTILTTKEQISANTNAANVTGALAAKAMMADINTINSNLQNTIYSNHSTELYDRMKYLVDNKMLPAGTPFMLRESSYGTVLLIGQIYPDYAFGEFLILQHMYLDCVYIACIDHSIFRLEKVNTTVVQ